MSIDFDFSQEQTFYFSAVNIAAGNNFGNLSTLGNVSLGSAAFPLQNGRVVQVVTDAVGIDSNQVPLGSRYTQVISMLSTGDMVFQGVVTGGYQSSLVNGNYDPGGAVGLHVNGSHDLVVGWYNNNSVGSGITHDVSVTVKLRWVGA